MALPQPIDFVQELIACSDGLMIRWPHGTVVPLAASPRCAMRTHRSQARSVDASSTTGDHALPVLTMIQKARRGSPGTDRPLELRRRGLITFKGAG
jgi:hypothetical protein